MVRFEIRKLFVKAHSFLCFPYSNLKKILMQKYANERNTHIDKLTLAL